MLPPTEEEDYVLRESGVEGVADPSSSETASKLRLLLDETADHIDSPSFSFVLTLLLNEGFSTLVDVKCANEAFKASTSPETAPQSFDSMATVVPPVVSERKTKLANLLAVMARQAHVIGHGPMGPNDYLDVMDKNVRELEAFSAVIYSSNFDLELLGTSRQPGASKGMDSMDPNSSAMFSEVVVDNEPEAGSTHLAQSTPVLIDQEERVVEIDEEISEAPVTEETIPVSSQEPAAESAFEQAWGKAMDEGNIASEPEVPETS